MPLFFIFSGYFYKAQPLRVVARHGNKHLVKPYVITSVVAIVLCLTAQHYDLAGETVVGALMSNGGSPHQLIGAHLPDIGPIWFLLALYWCKWFYAYLKTQTRYALLTSLVISTVALVVGKYVMNLPLGLLTGLCGMVFYAMGDYWSHKGLVPSSKRWLLWGIPVWMLCVCVEVSFRVGLV